MGTIVFVLLLAAGVWQFVDLYVFRFDELTEEELIRRSFYWVPLCLFGLLGLMAGRIERISNPVLFAAVGTLLGTVGLAAFIMLVFLD